MKKHLVRDCIKCPGGVKDKFKDIVESSSFSLKTTSVKRKFEVVELGNSDSNSDVVDSIPHSNPTSSCVSLASPGPQCSRLTSSHVTPLTSPTVATRKFLRQTKLSYRFEDCVSSHEQEKLDMLFAKAVYTTGTPLSISTHTAWKSFFNELRPSWIVPCRHKLSNSFLEKWDARQHSEVVE
jgi:hypothetical protein